MDEQEIRRRVKEIAGLDGDLEAAHCKKDDLYRELLEFIRHDAPEPYSAMAAAALESQNIDFPA